MNWHESLPTAETSVPCGGGTHTVRWEDGRLTLPAHPDAEAELVLGALGGEKPACVSLAETWERHADDLAVLAAGPRSAADTVTVTWEQVAEQRKHTVGLTHMAGVVAARPPGVFSARPAPGTQTFQSSGRRVLTAGPRRLTPAEAEEFARRARERAEVLELLALGPEFQFRLSGTVAAAWAANDQPARDQEAGDQSARNKTAGHQAARDEAAGERAEQRAGRRPELTAALTGRFAPVAAEWLGIDPDAVTITPHEGPGWGTLSLTADRNTGSGDTGSGNTGRRDTDRRDTGGEDGRELTGTLPVSWLADVWACRLTIVDGHLVVAVTEPGYPRAEVLALPEPGAEPIPLTVDR